MIPLDRSIWMSVLELFPFLHSKGKVRYYSEPLYRNTFGRHRVYLLNLPETATGRSRRYGRGVKEETYTDINTGPCLSMRGCDSFPGFR